MSYHHPALTGVPSSLATHAARRDGSAESRDGVRTTRRPVLRTHLVGHLGRSVAMRSPTRALVPFVLVLAALLAPAVSAAQPKAPSVIPPTAGRIDGRTYGEWSAEWWRQGYAVPRR